MACYELENAQFGRGKCLASRQTLQLALLTIYERFLPSLAPGKSKKLNEGQFNPAHPIYSIFDPICHCLSQSGTQNSKQIRIHTLCVQRSN